MAGPGGVASGSTTYAAGSAVPGAACVAASCTATLVGPYAVTGTDGAITSPFVLLAVGPAAAASLALTGLAASQIPGTADNGMVVTAYDRFGNVATGFTDVVYLASSDPMATMPAAYTFTSADAGVHRFRAPNGLMFWTPGTHSVSVSDPIAYPGLTATQSGIVVAGTPVARAYVAVVPKRILDTRTGIGLSGPFSAHVARTFQVTGLDIPASAVAVTGNLTATGQTHGGYL